VIETVSEALPIQAGLTVRIQLPPADSRGLAQTRPLQVEKPRFRAGVRGWDGHAVGRDAQGLVEIARPTLISLWGNIPVPALPLMGTAIATMVPANIVSG
jgi:hypothetical protein